MFPFVDPSDIAAVFRPLTDAEIVLADGLINQAPNKLRRMALKRGVDIDAITDPLTEDAIRTAVVNSVKRVLMNPEAVRQLSTTDGPFTTSKTIDSSISSGLLYFDPSDLADFIPARPRARSFRVRAGLL